MGVDETSYGRAAVFLAEGFEEIEGLTQVDLLRRAGIGVDTVSVTGSLDVVSSHNVRIQADTRIEDIDFDRYEALVLPGGLPGATNLAACTLLGEKLKEFDASGKIVAAICAAPAVLADLGILQGRHATSNPGFKDPCVAGGALYSEDPVVVDNQLITSRGMGTAIVFGFALVEKLAGPAAVEQLKPGIVWQGC